MCSDINKYNVIVYGSHQYHVALNDISISLGNALQEMGYRVFWNVIQIVFSMVLKKF